MKRLVVFLGLVLILLATVVRAQETWRINSFDAAIVLQESGEVLVTETIVVDFNTLSKHGIYRDIPEVYENNGEKTYTNVTIQSVRQGNDTAIHSEQRDNGYLRVKIGDPNSTISGSMVYSIRYQVAGVLRAFDGYDELYWNVTGNDWQVPIDTISATVTLPKGKITQSSCYSGYSGSTDQKCSTRSLENGVNFSGGPLLAGQGMTIAAGYTSGSVPIVLGEPPKVGSLWWGTILAILGVIIMPLFYIRRWAKYGRDEWYARKNLHDPNAVIKIKPLFSKEAIVPEYSPPNKMRPAEIGTLIDEKADTLDVSATIVDLAVRGYLTITEQQKKWIFGSSDYKLTRTTKSNEQLFTFEKKLLGALFKDGSTTVDLSSLKNSFYKDLKDVQDDIYVHVTERKLFSGNPQSVRTTAMIIPIIQLILAGIGLGVSADSKNIWLIVGLCSLLASAFIGILLASKMPRRSAEGREALRKTLGYKLFLSQTEKYRQPFLENQNLFMDVLPYAMVFGITKKLAESMQKIGAVPPQPVWYYGVTAWNPVLFTENIGKVSAAMNSAMASTPGGSGSGGAGFSGGGFGGGGGGSW